ncbi:MAG: PorP/SprF family type IX secretion system membrane protein [Bacteroidia bacterium]
MMKKILLLTTLSCLLPAAVWSQTFVQTTIFSMNRFLYNPAAAGYTGATPNITGAVRLQWLGIDGAPALTTLAAHTNSERLRGAWGGYAIYDKLGPLATTGLNLAYAYKIKFKPDDDFSPSLKVGVQLGMLQKGVNAVWKYNPIGGIDPLVGSPGNYSNSLIVPNLGAGLYFSLPGDDKLGGITEVAYVSFSALDLLEPSLAKLTIDPSKSQARVPRSFYLMGGYKFMLDERKSIQPNVMFKTDGTSAQFDVNGMMNIKPMTFGLGYRGTGFSNRRWDSMYATLGAEILDRLYIGYAYDLTMSKLSNGGMVNTHELIFSYTFPDVKSVFSPTKNTKGFEEK